MGVRERAVAPPDRPARRMLKSPRHPLALRRAVKGPLGTQPAEGVPQVQTRCPPCAGAPQSCSDGPGNTVQKANAPPCGRPRKKEACAGTLEKWRDKCCEHHWPNDLLTAARWTSPGRRGRGHPQIMGFSWGSHGVFIGFSSGFHKVFMGSPLEARQAMNLFLK